MSIVFAIGTQAFKIIHCCKNVAISGVCGFFRCRFSPSGLPEDHVPFLSSLCDRKYSGRAQRPDDRGYRNASLCINCRAAIWFQRHRGKFPFAQISLLLAGRAVEQAHAVARRDEQPVSGLPGGDRTFAACPFAGGSRPDQPGFAVGGSTGGADASPSMAQCIRASASAWASFTKNSFCACPANSSGRPKRGLALWKRMGSVIGSGSG